MVSYAPLWETMKRKGVTTYGLIHQYGINPRTVSNLKHDKGITVFTLERLCAILGCSPNEVLKFE